jgi:hypothetical protein
MIQSSGMSFGDKWQEQEELEFWLDDFSLVDSWTCGVDGTMGSGTAGVVPSFVVPSFVVPSFVSPSFEGTAFDELVLPGGLDASQSIWRRRSNTSAKDSSWAGTGSL